MWRFHSHELITCQRPHPQIGIRVPTYEHWRDIHIPSIARRGFSPQEPSWLSLGICCVFASLSWPDISLSLLLWSLWYGIHQKHLAFPKRKFPVPGGEDLIVHIDSGVHTGPINCGQGIVVIWYKQGHLGPTTIEWRNSSQKSKSFYELGSYLQKFYHSVCVYTRERGKQTQLKEKTQFLRRNIMILSRYLNFSTLCCKCENMAKQNKTKYLYSSQYY